MLSQFRNDLSGEFDAAFSFAHLRLNIGDVN
jgi:hypothetical protein